MKKTIRRIKEALKYWCKELEGMRIVISDKVQTDNTLFHNQNKEKINKRLRINVITL